MSKYCEGDADYRQNDSWQTEGQKAQPTPSVPSQPESCSAARTLPDRGANQTVISQPRLRLCSLVGLLCSQTRDRMSPQWLVAFSVSPWAQPTVLFLPWCPPFLKKCSTVSGRVVAKQCAIFFKFKFSLWINYYRPLFVSCIWWLCITCWIFYKRPLYDFHFTSKSQILCLWSENWGIAQSHASCVPMFAVFMWS